MSEKPDLKHALRSLADAEGWGGDTWDPRRGEHPPVEELSAYGGGELEGAREDRLQEHLTTCAECAALVADQAAFPHLDAVDGEPGEFEIAAGWRDLKGRLERQGLRRPAARSGSGASSAGRRSAGGLLHRPAVAWAVAAALLFAVLVLGTWNLQLDQRLDLLLAPQPNVPLADLDDGRTRSGGPEEVEVELRGPFYVLVLYADGGKDYADYRWRIVDRGSGEEVHAGEGLVKQEYFFTLQLHRGTLEPGVYQVELTGVTADGGTEPLGELPFRIPGA